MTTAAVIVVTVTVLADQDGRAPLTGSGARAGDVVAMVGRLGWAAAGLAVLTRGFRSPAAVVTAHRVPEVPYGAGRIAADAGATAMIDISDGLLADLGHLCRASAVSIDLDSSAFQIAEPKQAVAAAVGGGDPLVFQRTGGDDHALVGTFHTLEAIPAGWTDVGGVLTGGPRGWVEGGERALDKEG